MTPYYQDDACTIYHGDCRDVLPLLGPFDVVLTDPPYNVGIKYGLLTDDLRGDYRLWCVEWFEALRSRARVVLISPGIANLGMWHNIEQPTWVVAWHKPAAMGRCVVGFNNWEPVLLWGSTPRQTNDAFVVPLVPSASSEGHPCPKPVAWARNLIERFTLADDVVVDPFMGSGTTLRAAKDLGRRAIGIEIEERYCEIAANRLGQEVLAL